MIVTPRGGKCGRSDSLTSRNPNLLPTTLFVNQAATFYSISLNFQVLFPPFGRLPRYLFALLATAIIIPLGIVAKDHFYDALVNFLGSKFLRLLLGAMWEVCESALISMMSLALQSLAIGPPPTSPSSW